MVSKRKSKAEKEQERYEKKQRAWEIFKPKLEACNSLADVKGLLTQMPMPDTPSRGLFTSLEFFIGTLSPPGNASSEEKYLYIQLLKKMVASGEMKKETSDGAENALLKSMNNVFQWE